MKRLRDLVRRIDFTDVLLVLLGVVLLLYVTAELWLPHPFKFE